MIGLTSRDEDRTHTQSGLDVTHQRRGLEKEIIVFVRDDVQRRSR